MLLSWLACRRRRVAALVSLMLLLSLLVNVGAVSAAAGDLVFHGCVGHLSGCTTTTPSTALDGAEQVAVTGSNLYVTAATGNAVSHFTLDASGNPSFAGCIGDLAGCVATTPATALDAASGVAVQGSNLYVTGKVLSHLSLDSAGNPTFAGCIGSVTGCTAVSPAGALNSISDVAIRGKALYVDALQAVSFFKINAAGTPSFVTCIGSASGCTAVNPANALNGANRMAFSASNLYVAASFASDVSHLTLATNGSPTFADCIGVLAGCSATNPATALTDADGLAVSGHNLYATGSSNSIGGPGAVSQLTLDSAGTPSFVGCVGEKTGCTAITPSAALENAGSALIASSDLYVAWLHGVSHLRLGTTGAPTFVDCVGVLTGCASTTPGGALDNAAGMARLVKNVYVASVADNALSHLTR